MNALRIASKIAKRSTHNYAFHGAVVLRGGAIVATGYNHGWNHAEINALRSLWPSKRRGTLLWSIKLTKTGRLANAKPCADCEKFARESGVKYVYYSTPNGIERMKLSA